MAEDIDALAATSYAAGKDAWDVAVERIAVLIEMRDEVLKSRKLDPSTFPGFGSVDGSVIARRVIASLLDAGWSPPTPDQVEEAASRSRRATERFDAWLASLAPEERDRALNHYSEHGEFPPDLRPEL